jgi:hypothetical protein
LWHEKINVIDIPLGKCRCVAHQPPKQGTKMQLKKTEKGTFSNALEETADAEASSFGGRVSLELMIHVVSPVASALSIFLKEAEMGVKQDNTDP